MGLGEEHSRKRISLCKGQKRKSGALEELKTLSAWQKCKVGGGRGGSLVVAELGKSAQKQQWCAQNYRSASLWNKTLHGGTNHLWEVAGEKALWYWRTTKVSKHKVSPPVASPLGPFQDDPSGIFLTVGYSDLLRNLTLHHYHF